MSLPDKFPEGTKFLHYDSMDIVEFPDGKLVTYDPDPRPFPYDAIRHEPGIMSEEEFRRRDAHGREFNAAQNRKGAAQGH